MTNRSKLYSLFTLRCPRCKEGSLFVKRGAYQKGMAEMHRVCPNCELNFQREPGFYFGAAYVSYGLTIALWVSWFVALWCFDQWGILSFSIREDAVWFIVGGVVLLLALLPVIYRFSRSIWIHLFV